MKKRAIVAGHLCLDIFPAFENAPEDPRMLFSPGHLFPIESTAVACGGAVANTGGALLRLGVDTRLVARIGEDGFGGEVGRILERQHPGASSGLRRVAGEQTSYSIVISSPRFDRIFLHSSGANDRFTASDVAESDLEGRDLLHFGYPPAMRRMYEHDGEELRRLLGRAKDAGLTTALDLSYPQPGSKAARVDWRRLLEAALPYVDLFLPSYDELRLMLAGGGANDPGKDAPPEAARLREAAQWAISKGCAVCALKIGEEGLYVRTSGDRGRIAAMGSAGPPGVEEWRGRELIEPCFAVEAAGTTGSGDVTVAGFLAAVLSGSSLDESARMAVAAGAASVERTDAVSGLPTWKELERRVREGWERRPTRIIR